MGVTKISQDNSRVEQDFYWLYAGATETWFVTYRPRFFGFKYTGPYNSEQPFVHGVLRISIMYTMFSTQTDPKVLSSTPRFFWNIMTICKDMLSGLTLL